MRYRKLNLKNDYPRLKEIWENSEVKLAPQIYTLSPHGVVAENNKREIVGAIFQFFILDTSIVKIGFPILISEITEDRNLIVDILYEKAEWSAKYMGYEFSWTFSNLKHVQDRLVRNGYILGDDDVKQYVKII